VRRVLLLSLALLLCSYVYCQESVSDYLDDGKYSSSKGALKINAFALASGDLSLTYELILGKVFSIEASAGVLLPYGMESVFAGLTWAEDWTFSRDGGYSLRLATSYKLNGMGGEGWNYGFDILYRNSRNYRDSGIDRKETNLMAYSGYELPYMGRLTMEVGGSFGLVLFNDEFENENSDNFDFDADSDFTILLSFKIGYLL
jgi:hypothetical protein